MDEHKATNKEQGLYEKGKEAAALLWHRWRDRPEIEDLREPEFARGAMDEIIRLLAASPDLDKEDPGVFRSGCGTAHDAQPHNLRGHAER